MAVSVREKPLVLPVPVPAFVLVLAAYGRAAAESTVDFSSGQMRVVERYSAVTIAP